MKNLLLPVLIGALAAIAFADDAMKKLTPVPFTDVKFTDEFWAPRLERNRTVTIPHDFKMCETTGRITNFEKASGAVSGGHQGFFFDDSDVYKVIEGASYSLALHPDPELDKYVDGLIAKIAAAQREDGYVYTFYTVRQELDQRFSKLKDMHEMYCSGHLIEGAVAHYQATKKRNFLDVAIKLANYLDSIFGPDKKHEVDGHEEIELALFKLASATGDEKYRKLGEFFLSIRGTENGRKKWGPYFQDDQPIPGMRGVHGHAVRMMYLMCAATDAVMAGNETYRAAVDRLWDDMVTKKMYVTGGVGARHDGEAFGEAYELPNESAYSETCATIGNALWSHRMSLLHGDGKYADVVEQAVYNGFLSGWGLSGDKFFYVNPLASRGKHHRETWYGCACCPPNVARFLPQLAGMVYAVSGDSIYVSSYAANEAQVIVDGNEVKLKQETKYPWDGKVKIVVDPAKEGEFGLKVRIPGWCKEVRGLGSAKAQAGYAEVRRKWRRGDSLEFELMMPVERVYADPKVKADVGRVAVRRGPVVYCVEAVDTGGRVANLALPKDGELRAEHRADLLGGVTVIKGRALARQREGEREKAVEFQAVPYFAWDDREPGEMAVWLAEDVSLAKAIPTPTVANTSKASASYVRDSIEALNDETEIESSKDRHISRFTWWDHKGKKEWVQYDFVAPVTVSSVEVYWFDDVSVGGECRPPQSWRVLYKDGETWKPVQNVGEYTVAVDQYNRVEFKGVRTGALRVEVQLQPKYSGGILEWRVR